MPDFRNVEIHADLECDLDGRSVQIRSDGSRSVVCVLESVQSLLAIRRLLRRRIRLRPIGGLLSDADLAVEIQVAGDVVARLGQGADDRLLKWIGWSATELRFSQLAGKLLRHPFSR